MMQYLQASWGFDVMIGGLFLVLVILMILDGPAQRRDSLGQIGQENSGDPRPLGSVETRSTPDRPSSQSASGIVGKS